MKEMMGQVFTLSDSVFSNFIASHQKRVDLKRSLVQKINSS